MALAGQLFDMDFSTSIQQAQILKEKDGVVLLNNNVELGVIIIDKIHEQNVDLEIFSDSGKLITFITLSSKDRILQVDIDKDGSTDFVIDIQDPIENNEAIIMVKKGSYDSSQSVTGKTTVTTIKNTPQQITGGAVTQLKGSNLGFLFAGLVAVVGLVGYYLFTKKK
tara:strand:- start:418 stop:918 length:501 start_codon:yes stop_codon:yes gene_type:complete